MALTLTTSRITRISLFKTLAIIFCNFASRNGQNIQHQSKYFDFESYVPSVPCNINWILYLNRSCTWCESMFMDFIPHLTRSHITFSIHTGTKESVYLSTDLHGNCFMNWFMGTNFELLAKVIQSHRLIEHQNENWIIFIDVSYWGQLSWLGFSIYFIGSFVEIDNTVFKNIIRSHQNKLFNFEFQEAQEQEFLGSWKALVEGRFARSYPYAVVIMLKTNNLHTFWSKIHNLYLFYSILDIWDSKI